MFCSCHRPECHWCFPVLGMHKDDPRASKDMWCIDCKKTHRPTSEHPLCATGAFHLHKPAPKDLFFLFKGWKFTPPFHCMYCGVEVCWHQWAFSRSCGGCDSGTSYTAKLHYFQWTAGPHEIHDRTDSLFMSEEAFVPLEDVIKKSPLHPRKELFPYHPPLVKEKK